MREDNSPPRPGALARGLSCLGFLPAAMILGCDGGGTADASRGEEGALDEFAVVRVHEEIPEDLPRWRIADTAELSLGAVDEPETQVFGRVVGFVERSDGSIVIGDGNTEELLAFDRSGRRLWTAGGEGGGPGEFRELHGVFLLPGDSVMGMDRVASKMVVFDPSGELAREVLPEELGGGLGQPYIEGVLSDGTVVARAGVTFEAAGFESGATRGAFVLHYLTLQGEVVREVRRFPGREYIFEGGPDRSFGRFIPYGRVTQIAVGTSRVAVTTQDRFEVVLYDTAGAPSLAIRVNRDPAPIDRGAWRRYIENRTLRHPPGVPEEMRRGMERLADLKVPETLPAMDRIEVDADGRLWVQEWVAPFERRPPIWWVFDPEGHPIAVAEVPEGFEIGQIDSDHVVGLTRDEFRVPYVEVRRIIR